MLMATIVAIGGGEIGRPGYPLETLEIDKKIVEYCGKQKPKLCFVPTASNDSEIYIQTIEKLYGQMLGCTIKNIQLAKHRYEYEELLEIVMLSDIIYVGGGDSKYMLEEWRKSSLDEIIMSASDNDIVLAGLSAGAMCWFEYGASDSVSDGEIGLLKGLGLVKGVMCPHYQEEKRKAVFRTMITSSEYIGIGIENCAAISIQNKYIEILNSKDDASVFRVFSEDGSIKEEKLNVGSRRRVDQI